MTAEQRREQFKTDVAELKLKTSGSRRDGLVQGLGILGMVVGVIAAFVCYSMSLSQSSVDVLSTQVLALAFIAVTVLGAALYLAGALAKVLRLWLLRQLYEGQAHVDQLAAALGGSSVERDTTTV